MAIMQINTSISKIKAESGLGETFDSVFDIMLNVLERKVDTAFILDEYIFENVASWDLVLVAQVDDAAA